MNHDQQKEYEEHFSPDGEYIQYQMENPEMHDQPMKSNTIKPSQDKTATDEDIYIIQNINDMKPTKVENGEVIERFRKEFTKINDFGLVSMIGQCEQLEAFITNALNQQREELIKEIREGLPYRDIDGAMNYDDVISKKEVDEFLTKLEK